jgi:hypothetical protein
MKEVQLTKPYSYGPYNKFDETEQWIRITEGCPNQCPFCAEPRKFKIFKIPKIVRNKVKILDMNLLAKPESLSIIEKFGSKRVNNKVVYYELICGIDYRFLTQEIANELKKARFKNIRIAWDWDLDQQYKIKDAIKMLLKSGYKANSIMIFIICNWKIPYEINLKKLDLCKVWNVKVADCYFDNQTSPTFKPIYWTLQQMMDFRRKCRMHNRMVLFKIIPFVVNSKSERLTKFIK